MADFRITYWRDIPSMVTARDGGETAKAMLPQRFQDAIDDAAMRQGMAGSDAYLEQWRQGDWAAQDGAPDTVAAAVAARLEAEYTPERLETLLEV